MRHARQVDRRIGVDARAIAPFEAGAIGILIRSKIELEVETVGTKKLVARQDDLAYAIVRLAREQPFLQAREDLQLGLHRHFVDNSPVEVDEDARSAGLDPGVIGAAKTQIQGAAGESAEEEVRRGPE